MERIQIRSERNQKIHDQSKTERRLEVVHGQLVDAERTFIKVQRQERSKGVIPYVRDALRNHGKELIPEVIDCV